MLVRKTKPAEYRRVNALFAICFGQPYANCPIDPDNDRAVHWAAYTPEGEMMSCLTISDYDVHFDRRCCLMGGVGGVSTLPQYRRRGGVRACFEAALPDLYAQGYTFSYLYPFSTAFYRKFGYESCVRKLKWTVDLTLLNVPKTDGYFRLSEPGRTQTDAILAVDNVLEQRFNMMVQHGVSDYRWADESDPAVKQEFTYVWYSPDNQRKAYTTFKTVMEPDGRNLICSRFRFLDRDGFNGLMRIFKSLASDHRYVKFETPALPSYPYLMPEWSLGAVSWSMVPGGMVRVINVAKALEAAHYRGAGRVILEISDPQIPQNNARFAVTFEDGRAGSVDVTGGEPDAVMSISTFSALIAGVCDWEEAKQTFGGLKVLRDGNLHQIFYRKPLMICDYF